MLQKLHRWYMKACITLWVNYVMGLCVLFHRVLKFKNWETWVDEITMATYGLTNYLAPAMIVWAILV
jgi:hypothetical protein